MSERGSVARFLSPISFLSPEFLDARSAWLPHVPFGLWLVEAMRPSSIVELGTHTGVSYFTFCQAVERLFLDTRCHAVDSWLGDEHTGYYDDSVYEDVRGYNENHYARFSMLLRMSFDEAIPRFADGSVDLLHLDGCHTYEAARHDFDLWIPKLSHRGVVLLHDTTVTDGGFGVFRLWDELRGAYPHFEFLHGSGLGVLAMGRTGSPPLDELLETDPEAALAVETRAAYERLGQGLLDQCQLAELRADVEPELRARDRRIETRHLRALVERLSREAGEAEAELEEIRSSTTWRATRPARSFVARRPRLGRALRGAAKLAWWTVTLQLRARLREPGRRDGVFRRARTYERWVHSYDRLAESDIATLAEAGAALEAPALISVVMPVYDTDERFLREAIESVLAQTYPNWELCIADDASASPAVKGVLEDFQARDARVKVTTRSRNGGISTASNDALALASGEWVVLLDHDDLLRPHALFMVAETFDSHPDAVFVYSDEDKIDVAGRRSDPYFKPDWNPALFYSQNYICHLAAFRLSMAVGVGGFRAEYDGAQDWDLFLRLLAGVPGEAICHIPHVLYHWRTSEASTALSADAKPYALTAATRALRDRLAADGIEAEVETVRGRYQRVRYALPADPPPVTVVIPTTGDVALLGPCLDGLLHGTDYPKLTILLALSTRTMTGSDTRTYVEGAAADPRVRLLIDEDGTFNYSRVNNRAVSAADDDLICFLNDDTEPINRDWLSSMVGHVLQDRVGAVGAKLFYPQGSIQHGGVVLGLGGVAGHLHTRLGRDADGYFGRANLDQDLSCVTAGCMLIRRSVFEEVGGFDEALAIAFNDVDLCIRIRAAGWRIVWTPSAELYHRESISVGRHDSPARVKEFEHEVSLVRRRWGVVLDFDPHYSPNLSLEHQWELAFPPRVSYPWRQQRSAAGHRPR